MFCICIDIMFQISVFVKKTNVISIYCGICQTAAHSWCIFNSQKKQLQGLQIPNHWMAEFFKGHVALSIQNFEDGLQYLTDLSNAGFSQSCYIRLQMALAHYLKRGKKHPALL